MIEFPKDPFQKVAVFPLTADLVRPSNGRVEGTLQLGRDRVDRPLDDNPIAAGTDLPSGGTNGQVLALVAGVPTWVDPVPGYSEEVITFYEGEECDPVERTLLVKDE